MTSINHLNVMYEGNPLDLVEKLNILDYNQIMIWNGTSRSWPYLNYSLRLLRGLKRVLPKDLLMKIYKAYFQSKVDSGISVWGFTTQFNIDNIDTM